jgi:2-oxoglutarate ferredoxin oxidoreductase subunit gamma
MSEIKQIRLSGFGGQGIILAGALLGEAGVIDGKYVAESSSYGAQARGSGCKSEVVFSNDPIDFPHVTTADILFVMSQGTYDTYCEEVKTDSGLILFDESQVVVRKDLHVKQIGILAAENAIKKLQNNQVANIILLGSLIKMTKIVSLEAIQEAIRIQVSERFRDLNLKALQIGFELGGEVHG